MKKKLFYSIGFLALCGMNSHAQQAFVASGATAAGTGGSASYTIGQATYTNSTGTSGFVAPGVQQAFEIQTLLGIENFNVNLQLTVYPNPTANVLQLDIRNYAFENLNYQLFDTNGKMVLQSKITSEITTINMENVAKNIYFLKVSNNNQDIKTFKIIKN